MIIFTVSFQEFNYFTTTTVYLYKISFKTMEVGKCGTGVGNTNTNIFSIFTRWAQFYKLLNFQNNNPL